MVTKSFLFSHCFDLLIAGSQNLAIFFYMLRYVFLGVKENDFNMKWR